jgi:hypothetical protein
MTNMTSKIGEKKRESVSGAGGEMIIFTGGNNTGRVRGEGEGQGLLRRVIRK